MSDISKLIQEAKPYYIRKKKQKRAFISCLSILAIVFMFNLNFNTYSSYYDYTDEEFNSLLSGSIISDMGYEVDEYGLLLV